MKVDQFLHVFEAMQKENKWTDKKTLMMAASVYAVHDVPFSLPSFKELCDYIKKEAGMFSYLNGNIRFGIAAVLDVKSDDPKDAFHRLQDVYEELVNGGFGRNHFSCIAALALLQHLKDSRDVQAEVDRANNLYKLMRKEHPFITTSDDYPLAVLLSQQQGEEGQLINRMEHLYRGLHEQGFRKGNDLQFLSQILSLDEEHEPIELINRAVRTMDTLKQASLKEKPAYYPEIGMLSLVKAEKEMDRIVQVADRLNQEKHFKWQKDLNVKLAVQLVISDELSEGTLLETGLFTSIEVVMQAQQTAMIATIAASTAASSGGGE